MDEAAKQKLRKMVLSFLLQLQVAMAMAQMVVMDTAVVEQVAVTVMEVKILILDLKMEGPMDLMVILLEKMQEGRGLDLTWQR